MAAYHKQAYKGMENAIFPSYFHGKCLDETGVTPPGCPNPDCPIVCGTPGSLVHFFPKLRYIAFNQTYHLLQKLSTPGSETYQQVEDMVLQAASQSDGSTEQRRRSNSRIYPRGVGGVPVNAMQNNRGSASPVGAAGTPPPPPVPGAPPAGVPPVSSPATSGHGSSSGSPLFLNAFPGGNFGGLSSSGPGKKLLPVLKPRAPDVKASLPAIMHQMRPLLQERCGGNGEEETNGLPQCSWEVAMKEYILTFP